ncbi:SusC/RagA family TonB-linked outer membrane protein [Niabella insulamsoli]|uniref:SusC/RagA family TonB-linked outer membrane protein n=1 Tax=Niabella insulamsoli TaxID=3144874 RepID=UPI0031FCDD75
MRSFALQSMLLLLSLLMAHISRAQGKQVSGSVYEQISGSGLAGATIHNNRTAVATLTDENGLFQITAQTGDTLVISYAGYETQRVRVGQSENLTIVMESNTGKLGEVVVVGYGTQSRRNITSSIAKLDNKVLENAPRSNLGSALQGSIPGLQVVNATGQPGAAPVLVLRGGASINSPGGPLVVIDGVIRSYNDVAAEDIASMEVLKDAAATAIYGARANNGVILITTKKGAAGKAQISYKFTQGFNQRREGYQYLNAKDYIYLTRLGNLNSGRTLAQVNSARGYGLLTDAASLGTFDIRTFNSSNEQLLKQGWDTVGDPYGGTIIFKDHSGEVEDLVFRNTQTQEHYVNVMGGNDKGKYFSSFNYYKEDGVIVGSDYKRFSGNVNGAYKVRPNLEMSSGVTLSTSSQIGVNGSTINNMYRNLSLWPTFNPWVDAAKTQPNPGNGINDGNPLYWLDKQQRSNEVNRITAMAAAKWDILPSLYVKASANLYLYEQLDQSFTKATQSYTNIFSDPPTYNNTTRPASSTFERDVQQQYNGIINYTETFAGKHDVNAMIGAEYFGIKSFAQQVLGTRAPTDDIPTVNASTTFAAGDNFSNTSEYRIISAFGRLNYAYDSRYLLTLVFREDGVSSLAKANRWGFFPGMSAGWNMHEEAFFKNSALGNIVSTFKPRVSYGVNGNVAGLGRYEVQGGYSLQGLYNNNAGFLNTDIVNANLRWEKSKTMDIGADIGFLRNRISLIFDYYDRQTSDLLTNLSLPGYTGFNSVRTNLGTFQNKGYELAVSADVLKNADGVSLNLSANASYVKNKILQLPYNGNENNRQGGLQVYDPATGRVIWVGGLQEGQALGDIYAFKQLGIFSSAEEVAAVAGNRVDIVGGISGPNSSYGSGKITAGDVNWLDVDKNDSIDSRDQVYVGNIYPKWTGGFSANLSYKGFSLYSRFDFALGHTIYNDLVARTLGNYQGTFNAFDWQKDAWSPTNTQTDIPKVYYADQVAAPLGKKNYTRSNNANAVLNSNNSRFYEKGDYLAAREMTLSYDFSRSLLAHTKLLSQSRLYVTMLNMFYITKFSGPTPEPPVAEGSSTTTGIYRGAYPTPKSIVVGLQITF